MKIATPNNIEVLLHCHTTPVEHPRYGAPAVKEAFEMFKELGAIKKNGGYYVTTDLGRAWVESLCNTQIPKSVYVDEHGTILA